MFGSEIFLHLPVPTHSILGSASKEETVGQVLATYPSSSNPSKSYSIIAGADGVTYCDCTGWKMRKTCKHLQHYIANGGKVKVGVSMPSPGQKPVKATVNTKGEKMMQASGPMWGKDEIPVKVFESDEFQSLPWYQGCGAEIETTKPEELEQHLVKYETLGSYVAEPKLDGIWIASFSDGKRTRFWSRNRLEKQYGLADHPMPPGTFLIGELGFGSEHALQRRAQYGHDFMDVIGVLALDYKPILHLKEVERRKRLEEFMQTLDWKTQERFRMVAQYSDRFVERFKKEHEGFVLKFTDFGGIEYEGRKVKVPHWIKAKKWHEADMVIMDFVLSKAISKVSAPMVESIICGQYVDGKLKQLTKVGNGIDDTWSKEFAANFKKYKGKVMKIAHYQQFVSGALRHPSFMAMRDDKDPEECVFVPKGGTSVDTAGEEE